MLVTVSDKKIGVDIAPQNGIIDYYIADVVTANDNFPFGMNMPSRKYTAAGSGYRYGFNGKENDKDAGEGIQDYGMRVYDVRLGKFLSVDPLSAKYAYYTPYQFAGNTVIQAIDLDGEEPFYVASRNYSIKYYYQRFNPENIFAADRPFWQANPNDITKYGLDAVHRLELFATDNNKEYRAGIARNIKKGIDNAEMQVYYNSQKFGYYDCITSVEASMQILKNNYNIKVAKGGNILNTMDKWKKEGIVGDRHYFSVKNFNKEKGSVVTQKDFTVIGVAEKILSIADKTKNGTTFFVIALGGDDHSALASVTVTNGVSKFALIDQINGYSVKGTAEDFNNYMAKFLYVNSSSEINKTTRVYTPKSKGNKDKIPEGELNITVTEIKR